MAAVRQALMTLRDDRLQRLNDLHDDFDQDIAAFAEMKASRDVLEHANGIANALYFEKAGGSARFKVGNLVTVDTAYHTPAFHLVQRLIRNVADAAIAVA